LKTNQRNVLPRSSTKVNKQSLIVKTLRTVIKYRFMYMMLFPVITFYIIFKYWPMYGLIISFKRFNPGLGIMGSPWIGFRYYEQFFNSIYFWRLLRNTLMINLYDLAFVFPAPIIFALMLNEVRALRYKRIIQTVSYLPHFVSTVIIASMVFTMLNKEYGLVNHIIASLGGERKAFLYEAGYFWGVFTAMNVWKGVGWGSIVYLAAIAGINPELYESAIVDGANHWRQAWHITLPCISNVIIIMLILRIGRLLSVGYQAIILLYNPLTYVTADVINTFVYRRGLLNYEYSYATAVGFFQSVVGFLLVVLSNKIARKYSETSLW
jgi:putative aldouronate transport system permease protein